jgi:aromatic ring-opening dioxygenase LigB subunit
LGVVAFRAVALGAVVVSDVANDAAAAVMAMAWAVLVPLWFAGGRGERPLPAVVIAPARDMSFETHVRAGEALRKVFDASPRRIALIASCDHGHAHAKDGPYGYHPAAKAFDERVQEIVRADRLERLLEIDPGLIRDGKPDSYWQMLMLHGALRGDRWRGELLSYEAPTYFGMLCASYERAA